MLQDYLVVITIKKMVRKNLVDDPVSEESVTEGIVTIGEENLTQDDLDFYILIEKLKIQLSREEDKAGLSGNALEDKMAYWDEQLVI